MAGELFPPTIDELIAEAEREVKMRLQVYPAQVAAKRMSQNTADRRIALMRRIVEVLGAERDFRRLARP